MTDKELVLELQKELTALKKQIEYMEMNDSVFFVSINQLLFVIRL